MITRRDLVGIGRNTRSMNKPSPYQRLQFHLNAAYRLRPDGMTSCLAGGVNRSMEERDATRKEIAASRAKHLERAAMIKAQNPNV